MDTNAHWQLKEAAREQDRLQAEKVRLQASVKKARQAVARKRQAEYGAGMWWVLAVGVVILVVVGGAL